ncbi:hypothetical protein QTP86_006637 [Hemibagrus guttatus]|nr:hypothetical protein QTP86_006637 [Hemibagrus guttatus]
MLSGPAAYCGLTLHRVFLTSAVVRQHLVLWRRDSLPRCHVILCLKPSVEAVQRIWKRVITVTGRWSWPVVGDGLDALPHAPSVIAALEVAVDSLGVCTLCLPDGSGDCETQLARLAEWWRLRNSKNKDAAVSVLTPCSSLESDVVQFIIQGADIGKKNGGECRLARVTSMSQKVMIIDTDCGIDDAQAIMLALSASNVKILGITCCFGNTDVDNVCKNVLRVSLVVLGPMTNLALAVRMDPSIPNKLKDLYIMGGNMEGKGNMTPCAEFNFLMDPESAYVVLEEFVCPTYIATWEFACRNKLSWEFFDKMVDQDTAAARFMKTITSKCPAFSREPGNNPKDILFGSGFVPYDTYAMAACVDSSMVTESVEYGVRVEIQGELGRGMMVLDVTGQLKSNRVFLMKSCDLTKFSSLLMTSLNQP